MDDLEQQLRAWTDATVADAGVDPVIAEEARDLAGVAAVPASATGGGWRGRWTWLAAAAVLVALAVGGAVVALAGDGGDEPVGSGDLGGAPSTSDPTIEPDPFVMYPPVDPASIGEVGYEVLHVGSAEPLTDDPDELPAPLLRAASTPEQLEELWLTARHLDPTLSSTPPQPDVDLDEQVVVSIVAGVDACPRALDGFALSTRPWGAGGELLVLQPALVEAAGADCVPTVGGPTAHQYLVAIDWDSVGNRFELQVVAGNLAAVETSYPDRTAVVSSLVLDRGRPDPVLVDLHLVESTLPAGGELNGVVTVSNASGEPIDIGFCGSPFAVGLSNDEVDQQMGFDGCLEEGQIVPGLSSFEVTLRGSYLGCSGGDGPLLPGDVRCLPEPNLGPPPLPAGEYRTRVYPPAGLDDVVAPTLTVTVTDP
jgi:hypothetical protein